MASTIKLKNGSGAPLASDLVAGEPAFDLTNKRLYTEDSGGTVIEVGTNPTEIQIDNINIDGNTISSTDTDGNIAITPDGTGEVDISKVDIDSGTIDNTVIGGTTTAAGSFTTLQADTSLNVDGTVTADGLTVDTDTLYVDATNNRVGIGTSSPDTDLDVSSSTGATVRIQNSSTGLGDGTAVGKLEMYANDGSSNGTGAMGYLETKSTSAFGNNFKTTLGVPVGGGNNILAFANGSEHVFLNGSGNVGIGTTSPTDKLTVNGGIDVLDNFSLNLGSNQGGGATLLYNGNGNLDITPRSGYSTVFTGGNVGIGTDSPSSGISSDQQGLHIQHSNVAYLTLDNTNGSKYTLFSDGDGNFRIHDLDVPTERMRIDSSGNLLVNATSLNIANTGHGFGAYAYHTRSGEPVLYVNRTTSDGSIIEFRKDNAPVGSIGVDDSDLYIGTGVTGLLFFDTGNRIVPFNTSTGGPSDNTTDLGDPSFRFDDVYATNGTIQTSDRNEKQDIEELSEAEQRVAVAAKALLRKFRWIDSVEENGDDARIHFGIIAQDLQAAFEAEGLDAGRYAMFIHSTWTDEETGEERSRMGVRYSELLAFIIAAI